MLSRRESCLQKEHRLERMAATPPNDAPGDLPHRNVAALPTVLSGTGRQPVSKVDVYVDDFILMAQTHHQRTQVMQSTPLALMKSCGPCRIHSIARSRLLLKNVEG